MQIDYKKVRRNLLVKYYSIKKRCYNKGDKRYKTYGKRGIRMCAEWFDHPQLFIDWSLMNGYEKGLQIDRIDNDYHYTPSNCRYITHKINCLNKTTTVTSLDGKSRKCSNCKRNLPIHKFPKDKSRYLGIGYICRACDNEIKRNKYNK